MTRLCVHPLAILEPSHYPLLTSEELATATLSAPFGFSKGAAMLKVSGHAKSRIYDEQGMRFFQDTVTVPFDTVADPEQRRP